MQKMKIFSDTFFLDVLPSCGGVIPVVLELLKCLFIFLFAYRSVEDIILFLL
jgi:hypothetical protein